MLRREAYGMYLALAVVGIVGVAVAGAVDAFFGTAEALENNVHAALLYVPRPRDGAIDLVHACFRYSDLVRGQQIAALVFLLGGVPCAVTGAALVRGCDAGTRPAADCSGYVRAGLVFQVCSLALTGFLLIVLTGFALLLEPGALIHPLTAVLVLLSACNIWGVRRWRAVECQAPAALLTSTR